MATETVTLVSLRKQAGSSDSTETTVFQRAATLSGMAAKWNKLAATAYVVDQMRHRYGDLDAYGAKQRIADALGIPSPQSIGQWQRGERAMAIETFEGIADKWGVGADAMREAANKWAKDRPELLDDGRRDAVVVRDTALPQYGRIPGYDAVEAEARRRAPYLPPEVWDRLRQASGAQIQEITPEFLVGQANLFAPLVAGRAPLRPDQRGDGLREMPDDGERPPAVKSNANRRK